MYLLSGKNTLLNYDITLNQYTDNNMPTGFISGRLFFLSEKKGKKTPYNSIYPPYTELQEKYLYEIINMRA